MKGICFIGENVMKKLLMALTSSLILSGAVCAAGSSSLNEKSKILVAYYSDTGTTKAVAEKIASYLNADLLKIESAKPYSRADLNWNDRNSRVVKEHDSIFGSKGNGQATASDMKKVDSKVAPNSVIDLSRYDTIFIGYPIWWGMAAWPVNGFVTQNNFAGKTVVPFATSMSSGLGSSDKVLCEIAGSNNGNWLSGKRFGTYAGESEIRSWVDTLIKK